MFVVVTRSFPPDIGGMQNLMEGLSKSLVEHGPVKVFADGLGDAEGYDKNSKLNIIRISGLKLFRKYRKAKIVSKFIREKKDIRAIFFDHWKSIEHIHNSTFKNIPTYCLIHSKEIFHPIGTSNNARMKKAFSKASFIIANSNFTKKLAVKCGIDASKIRVIFPGINVPIKIDESTNLKSKEIIGNSYPSLITVARLDKRKNHEKVIMVLKNLKSEFPRIKYVIVGSGDEEKNLQELVKELKLDNEVVFLKEIDIRLKIALTKNVNFFIMPSIIVKRSVEGFGIAFMEAASYGIPSIGGKDGGASDAIKDNVTGIICNGENINSIYDSIKNLINDKKYINYGNAAKEFSESFHWNKVVKQYLELIN